MCELGSSADRQQQGIWQIAPCIHAGGGSCWVCGRGHLCQPPTHDKAWQLVRSVSYIQQHCDVLTCGRAGAVLCPPTHGTNQPTNQPTNHQSAIRWGLHACSAREVAVTPTQNAQSPTIPRAPCPSSPGNNLPCSNTTFLSSADSALRYEHSLCDCVRRQA